MYQYAASPQFPANSCQDSNYWVDVVFTAGARAPPRTASLYNGAATPGEIWYPDASPVTLGMKFRSDAAGKVTGMRFWKGDAGNNGTHIALLYSATGQLLAQAPFAGETSSGWQTVMFSSPRRHRGQHDVYRGLVHHLRLFRLAQLFQLARSQQRGPACAAIRVSMDPIWSTSMPVRRSFQPVPGRIRTTGWMCWSR